MSLGIAIQSLPNVMDVVRLDTDDPYLIEILAPIDSETVDEAVAQAAVIAQQAAQAALSALIDGAPTAIDTFLEAYNRFVADEALAAALNQLLSDTRAALFAHTGNTGNPHATTKAQVGLGNVANLAPADLPVSTAAQQALDLKAPLSSPSLTGVPMAPTAAPGTSTGQIASTGFVAAAVAALINAAPGALDTLKELADAIGDDPNYAASIASALAGKVPNVRALATSGLATGGGDLSTDRTITVTAASTAQAQTGTDAATVITPALLKAVIAYTFQQPNVLSALLPTTLPAQAGVPWLNGGFVAIS